MGQLEDYQVFKLIVEQGSISRAANTLNIAKSAVSRRLNLLEERLEVRLVNRAPGNWEITAVGHEFYQRISGVVSDAEEIKADFFSAAASLNGPLSISAPREFGLAYLTPMFFQFQKTYPEIQLTVDLDDRLIDLPNENYDFAIRISSTVDDNLISTKIGTSRHRLLASPSYIEANGQPQNLDELSAHKLLHFGSVKRGEWKFICEKKEIQFEFQPSMNSNNGQYLLSATKAGIGISRLPDFISKEPIRTGELVPILPELLSQEWSIYALYSASRHLNRRMRVFLNTLTEACLS